MPEPFSPADQQDIRRARYEAAVSRDWRYEQFFNFLRISPSYLLAHRRATGAIKRLSSGFPADFADVQVHYNRLGSVMEQTYREWWLDTGQFVFGVAVEPELEVFLQLARMEEPTERQLLALQHAVEEYLVHERPSLASPPTLIMALPIHPDRGVLLQAINQMLSQVGVGEQPEQRIAAYTVERNKIREATVKQAWRVLTERVAAPSDALWQIGNRARVSVLHLTGEGAVRSDHEVRDKRRIMAILTSRELQRAYVLAENAARGRFPSFDRLPNDKNRPNFDHKWLAGLLTNQAADASAHASQRALGTERR